MPSLLSVSVERHVAALPMRVPSGVAGFFVLVLRHAAGCNRSVDTPPILLRHTFDAGQIHEGRT